LWPKYESDKKIDIFFAYYQPKLSLTGSNGPNNQEYKMTDHKMNVYYLNLDNLLDTNDILTFLRKKYNNYDSGEDLWVFHKGFFIGSYNDIIQIIDKKKFKK
jgi:hypothetical protein